MKILKKMLLVLAIINFITISAFLIVSKVEASVSDEVAGMTGSNQTVNIGELKGVINKLLGFLQVASGMISVIVVTTTGFNYIIAQTSDMKKEIKDKMFPIVIGIVLVFSAASISKFLIGTFEGTSSSGGTNGT